MGTDWKAVIATVSFYASLASCRPAPKPGSLAVRGRITNESGSPVRDAAVWLHHRPRAPPAQNGRPVKSAITDADGTFAFVVDEAGTYALTASERHHGAVRGPAFEVSSACDLGPHQLRLGPAPTLRGVAKLHGAPMREAKVRLIAWPAFGIRDPEVTFEAVSASDGTFRVTAPPGPYTLEAERGDELFSEPIEVHVTDDEEVPVELEPASSQTFELVDDQGEPVRGGRGWLSSFRGLRRRTRDVVAAGNHDGRLELRAKPTGTHWFTAIAGELVGVAGPFEPDVQPGQRARVIAMQVGACVEGSVVDERGRPVSAATVSIASAGAAYWAAPSVTTGSDGRFRARGIPRESAIITASANGRAPTIVTSHAGEGSTCTRLPEIVMPSLVHVRGHVSDDKGAPLARAAVKLERLLPKAAMPAQVSVACTKLDGSFEMLAPSTMEGDRLAVLSGAGQTIERLATGAKSELLVRVPRRVEVTGRTRYEDGSPAPGVRVEVADADAAKRATTVSDGSGRFRLRVPRGGPIALVATRVGDTVYSVGWPTRNQAKVETDGDSIESPDLHVRRGGRAMTIAVTSDTGSVAGVTVTAKEDSTSQAFVNADLSARTNGAGVATLRDLPAGRYAVTADCAPSTLVTVDTSRGAHVRVSIRCPARP